MAGSAGAEIDGLDGGSKAAFDVGDGATVSVLTTDVSLFRRTGNVAGRSFGMALVLSVVAEVVRWRIPRHCGWGPIRAPGISYRHPREWAP
jgi:hypothetical protein